jgi:nucleoside phosphorylase
LERVDVLVLTVLERELSSILSRMSSVEKRDLVDDPLVYYKGQIALAEPKHFYDVVACRVVEMGNTEAAIATTKAIENWDPLAVLLVGIAGGLRDKIGLGDVVVGDVAAYYESGKQREGNFEYRGHELPASFHLLCRARELESSEWVPAIRVVRPAGGATQSPAVVVGTIASGEKIIADASMVADLQTQYPKLAAVAMEGAGVSYAIQRRGGNRPEFIEIRGISDYADDSKNDSWQEYAADSAAAFVASLLKRDPLRTLRTFPREKAQLYPALAVRMQSFSPVNPSEVIAALEGQGFVVRDGVLDFRDLTKEPSFPIIAAQRMTSEMDKILNSIDTLQPRAVAFFGQCHIPLASLAGFLLSDRLPIQLFDFHPDEFVPSWAWPKDDAESFPALDVNLTDSRKDPVASVRISISYSVLREQVRSVSADAIDIQAQIDSPIRGVVKSMRQANAYSKRIRALLDSLVSQGLEQIHLFYAGPVSVAFRIGQVISASIHPRVLVWNFNQRYDWAIDLHAVKRGDISRAVVWAENAG